MAEQFENNGFVNFNHPLNKRLVEYTPVHFAIIDPEFKVVYANNLFSSKFGKADGRHCFEIYKHRHTACEKCEAKETFIDGQMRVMRESGFDSDGNPTQFIVHVAPLYNDQNAITHIVEMSYDITREETLKSEYNTLFERVPCAISIIDRDLKIVRANKLLRDTFGEVENEYCYTAYKDRDSACPYCPAKMTFEDGETHSSKHAGITKKGDPTYYVVSSIPLKQDGDKPEHVLEMSLDVTETHQLSQKLIQESDFRRNITESALDALIAVDENGLVQVFNPAAEKLFGLESDAVIGSEGVERFFPESYRRVLVEGGSSLSIPETAILDASGERIPVRVSGAVLKDDIGQVIGGAASFQDLRAIKALEREKLERERLAAVGQTVAVIAHAIKNILVGIQGGMYKLKSGRRKSSDELIEHGLDMLDRNFDRVAEIVRGLLDLSRNKQPELERIDINEMLGELYQLFKDEALRRGVAFTLVPLPESRSIYGDQEGLHTCLANFISNAMDACSASGKEHPAIELRAGFSEKKIVLETRDNGTGISEDLKKKLFTMFFTTKGVNGSGLGLAVTQKIVQEHNGTIEIDSQPGDGACFRMVLDPRELEKMAKETKLQAGM